jgi:hypothetical protein
MSMGDWNCPVAQTPSQPSPYPHKSSALAAWVQHGQSPRRPVAGLRPSIPIIARLLRGLHRKQTAMLMFRVNTYQCRIQWHLRACRAIHLCLCCNRYHVSGCSSKAHTIAFMPSMLVDKVVHSLQEEIIHKYSRKKSQGRSQGTAPAQVSPTSSPQEAGFQFL